MRTDKGNDRFAAIDGTTVSIAGRGLWDLGPDPPVGAPGAVSHEAELCRAKEGPLECDTPLCPGWCLMEALADARIEACRDEG
ncbi:hypothetical protein H7U34_06620 [Collinsella tanakaei]|nr:hypothetical protein [Collinsella tanakaei]